MTLRQKTLVTTIMVFMALAIIMLWVSFYILQSGFRGIEKRSINLDMERALSFIEADISELSSKALDYSGWDDTYDFIQDHQPAYVRKNYNLNTLVSQKLNLVMLLDSAGNKIYETGFDLQKVIFTPVPQMLQEPTYVKRLLDIAKSTGGTLSGIILSDEGPMMISLQPILKSDLTGPCRGAMIMGRFLYTDSVLRLSQLTHQNLQLYRFNDNALTPDLKQARLQLNTSKSITVQPLSEETIKGYGRIDDILGQPALILSTTEPRTIYQQGVLTIKYMFVFLLICATVFMLISFFLFERLIMRRLSCMSEEALEIGNSDHVGRRFLVSGNDELSVLGNSMNTMMGKIDQAESLLRKEASRYRAVVEDQTELICRYLPDGTLIFINDAYCRYYGKNRSDLLGSQAPVRVSEQDHEHVARSRQALSRENPTITYEYRVSLVGDRIRWQQATERMIPDEVGQPLEFQMVIQDVTDRKQMEESLKNAYAGLEQRIQERTLESQPRHEQLSAEIAIRTHIEEALSTSEKKYAGIIENVGIGIIMLDKELKIATSNRQMKEWFPDFCLPDFCLCKHDDLEGKNPGEFICPAVKTFRDGQVHEVEKQICVRGQRRLFRIVSSAIRDKNDSVEAVIELLEDITERRQAEEILRVSEARYRGIVEDQTELICRMTPTGHLTFVNEVFCLYFGKEFGDLIGKDFLSLLHYEDGKNILNTMSSLSPDHPEISFDCRVFMDTCEIRWLQWTNRAIFSERNGLVEHQIVGRDVTDRKQAEEALRERQRELDEKSRSLEEANIALRVFLQQKDADRKEIEERIVSNINELVMPYVEKLKIAPLDARNKTCVEILEANLGNIRSAFTERLTSGMYNFTSKEIDVANLIREGKSTKEIAELLYLSKYTVDFHRNNIRKKLGINNEKMNLRSYLASLS